MRRHYQAVLLLPEGCEQVASPAWQARVQALGLQVSPWPLRQLAMPARGSMQWPDASAQVLARLAPYWAHFDLCLLPVTSATLAWTRVALGNLGVLAVPPVVVLAEQLSLAAVADLMRLGVADFVGDPTQAEELWVRVQALRESLQRRVVHGPVAPDKPLEPVGALAERAAVYAEPTPCPAAGPGPAPSEPDWVEQGVRQAMLPAADLAYRLNRDRILDSFEREYVSFMLRHHGGNVTRASAAGGITRRSFWRLMRKFDIESATFRREAQGRMAQRWRPMPLKSEGFPS